MSSLLRWILPLVVFGVVAAPAAASSPVPELDWQPCRPGFECATAKVPLDYARPHGRTIDLALTRARAADPATRIGSVFVHPGGPGSSGVDFVQGAPPQAIGAITRRFDLVGFDARGAGHSRPLINCGVDQEREGLFAQPFARPETLDAGALVTRTAHYVHRCAARNADLLDHVSSADVAPDLDLLRAAVGDKRLNYVGHSYGSLVGATYASLFEGRARALVLDSPMDADTWAHRPFEAVREQTASLEHSLSRFFAATGTSEDDFDALLEDLDEHPLGGLDGDDARIAAMVGLYSSAGWPGLADAIAQARGGDGAALRGLADEWYRDGLFAADLMAVTQALDQRYPHRVGPFLRAGRHAASLFPHFALNSGYSELSFGLMPVDDRSAFHGPFRNSRRSGTALVIGTRHDPYTPFVWAKRLTADLGNARLLTFRADGHGSITSLNPCIVGHLLAYLEAGALPEKGATC